MKQRACTARATSGSRIARRRRSTNRRTPSSGSRPPACAGRTSGRIAGSSRSTGRRRWGTNTAASSRRSAAPSGRSSRGSSSIGSFATSDNTCPQLPVRLPVVVHAPRVHDPERRRPVLRVPLADGTLVPTPGVPSDDFVPSLLTTSDVLGTGWFAADAANVKPGSTVAVVGDGAVGLLGGAVGEADGGGADHRHEPPRDAAAARPRVRRDRHR